MDQSLLNRELLEHASYGRQGCNRPIGRRDICARPISPRGGCHRHFRGNRYGGCDRHYRGNRYGGLGLLGGLASLALGGGGFGAGGFGAGGFGGLFAFYPEYCINSPYCYYHGHPYYQSVALNPPYDYYGGYTHY